MARFGKALLFAACALLAGTGLAKPAKAADRPNIVVIVTDDQGDESPAALMPTVKKLSQRGIIFQNSFVDFSECCPSRASFLTGQSAHNSGVNGNNPPDGGYANYLPQEGNALNVWLHDAGYRTGLVGKFMNGYEDADNTHVPPGWDEWDVLADPKGIYRYFDYVMNENGTLVNYHHLPTDYNTDVIGRKAVNFIASASTAPFFLLIEPMAPHGANQADDVKGTPVPPPRYDGLYGTLPYDTNPNFNETDVSDKPDIIRNLPLQNIDDMNRQYRTRRETMRGVDDMVKDVLAALKSAGKLNNTYIVLTSDNGWSQGNHRWVGKLLLYEEANRVPLIVIGPTIPQNQQRFQLVNNLDLTATVLDWAGVAPGRVLDGRSLTPVIQNAKAPWRTALLLENKHTWGVRTSSAFYSESDDHGGGQSEFYDLKADPYQLDNTVSAPASAARVTALRTVLATLRACVGPACWVNTTVH